LKGKIYIPNTIKPNQIGIFNFRGLYSNGGLYLGEDNLGFSSTDPNIPLYNKAWLLD
jgi:hypothetical protein